MRCLANYIYLIVYLKIFKNSTPSGHIGTCFLRSRLRTTLKLQYTYIYVLKFLNYNISSTYINVKLLVTKITNVKLHLLLITNYKKTSAAVKNRFKFTKTFVFLSKLQMEYSNSDLNADPK